MRTSTMRIGKRRSARILRKNMEKAIAHLRVYMPPESQTTFVRNLMEPDDRTIGNAELRGMIRAMIQMALHFQPSLVPLFLDDECRTVRLILRMGALFIKTYIL
ncbi:uncharacterized protein Dana_GF24218 [Drosophila ananassae]|uniref:Uncharacterized protein n=1 Tax=Drosophila ananassae TaxID=7217 RepID=B3M816_DROAN|nr:uncharacterized protein LOC6506851 [Drosophila ananassae]EDV39924.2 uncharacterized protein Dana_GF24218 [Drosophila ananassae]